MTTIYTRSLSSNFGGNLNPSQLIDEINVAIGSPSCFFLENIGDVVNIYFASALSGPQQTTLNGVIAAHVPANPAIQNESVSTTSTQTLTNKTLSDSTVVFADQSDLTKRMLFECSGITTGTTRTLTVPNANDTLVVLTTAQTLTNKTLTSPVISTISNTGTLTLPTATDTLVGRATTDTLTNKTLTGATNTISASQLRTAGADVVISAATAPTTSQILQATSATTATWQNPNLYGTEYNYAVSTSTQTSTTTTFADYITFTTTSLPSATYKLSYSVRVKNGDTASATGFRVTVEGVLENGLAGQIESQDANNFYCCSGFKNITLSGVQTVALQMNRATGTGTVSLVFGSLELIRASS